MRPTHLRFTMRRMMVAVALAALLVAWSPVSRSCRERSLEIARANADWDRSWFVSDGRAADLIDAERRSRWRSAMERKYLWAADHPWLPVLPDPPKPE